MKTLTADNQKRVRIPDCKPRQVFSYKNEHGTFTLTPVVEETAKSPLRAGHVARDGRTGLFFWQGDITDAEAEDAALSANLERE